MSTPRFTGSDVKTHKGIWLLRYNTCPSRHIASRAAMTSEILSVSTFAVGKRSLVSSSSGSDDRTCDEAGFIGDVETDVGAVEFESVVRAEERPKVEFREEAGEEGVEVGVEVDSVARLRVVFVVLIVDFVGDDDDAEGHETQYRENVRVKHTFNLDLRSLNRQ